MLVSRPLRGRGDQGYVGRFMKAALLAAAITALLPLVLMVPCGAADGAPAETFLLNAGNHENFANFAEFSCRTSGESKRNRCCRIPAHEGRSVSEGRRVWATSPEANAPTSISRPAGIGA